MLESRFNNAVGLLACDFIKKRLRHRCFPVKFAKFLRTPILKNICERLPLALGLMELYINSANTAQEMKFSLTENFIFCAV